MRACLKFSIPWNNNLAFVNTEDNFEMDDVRRANFHARPTLFPQDSRLFSGDLRGATFWSALRARTVGYFPVTICLCSNAEGQGTFMNQLIFSSFETNEVWLEHPPTPAAAMHCGGKSVFSAAID